MNAFPIHFLIASNISIDMAMAPVTVSSALAESNKT